MSVYPLTLDDIYVGLPLKGLTKRFVPATALSFFGIIKNFDPGSFSHVTRMFVCKQIVISFGVLFVLKC